MLARLCRNNPTGLSFNIYSPLVTSYKFREEEEEKEVFFHEYTTKIYMYLQGIYNLTTLASIFWSIEI
jgi:hypothetical protein